MLDFTGAKVIPDPRKAAKDAEEVCHNLISDIFRGAYIDTILGINLNGGKAILISQNEETGWPQVAILEPGDDGDKH